MYIPRDESFKWNTETVAMAPSKSRIIQLHCGEKAALETFVTGKARVINQFRKILFINLAASFVIVHGMHACLYSSRLLRQQHWWLANAVIYHVSSRYCKQSVSSPRMMNNASYWHRYTKKQCSHLTWTSMLPLSDDNAADVLGGKLRRSESGDGMNLDKNKIHLPCSCCYQADCCFFTSPYIHPLSFWSWP